MVAPTRCGVPARRARLHDMHTCPTTGNLPATTPTNNNHTPTRARLTRSIHGAARLPPTRAELWRHTPYMTHNALTLAIVELNPNNHPSMLDTTTPRYSQ
jgi:hypothetical protein